MRPLVVSALIAFAALLVFAGAWFDAGTEQPAPVLETPAGSDYYLVDAVLRQYAADGSLRYQVAAARSLHFPNDSARLSTIRVRYPGAERGVWRLGAATGRVPPGSRDIQLSGGVTVTHESGAEALRIKTPCAWVRTEAGLAETEAPITANGPGQHARAVGMTLYFDRELLKLHHDVQVTYTP